MFHISLLKLHQGNLIAKKTSPPPTSVDNHPIIQLATIIGQEILPNGTTQVLVQWQGLPWKKKNGNPI